MSRSGVAATLVCAALGLGGCDAALGRLDAAEGRSAYATGDLRAAAASYQSALERLPENLVVMRNLAITFVALGRAESGPASQKIFAEATRLLRRALERDDSEAMRADLTELLVNAWVESGDGVGAAAYFTEQAQRNDDPGAWRVVAALRSAAGDFAGAHLAQQARRRLGPEDANAHLGDAILIWEWLRQNPPADEAAHGALLDEGLAAAERAASLVPHEPTPLIYQGLLLRERAVRLAQTDGRAANDDLRRAEELRLRAEALARAEETEP